MKVWMEWGVGLFCLKWNFNFNNDEIRGRLSILFDKLKAQIKMIFLKSAILWFLWLQSSCLSFCRVYVFGAKFMLPLYVVLPKNLSEEHKNQDSTILVTFCDADMKEMIISSYCNGGWGR